MINKLSHIGKYHSMADGENQDHICSGENSRFTVITLADGVSSCKEAKAGAIIAGNELTRLLIRKGELLQEYEPEEIASMTLSHILYELEDAAKQADADVKDYSSTVASVLHDKENGKLICMSLGDSIIIGASEGNFSILNTPYESSEGCCVTTTAGAESETEGRIIDDSEFDSVIICSDGAWRQMLNRNRLKDEIITMLEKGDFDRLKDYLTDLDGHDDYSFISMDIERRPERNERRLR